LKAIQSKTNHSKTHEILAWTKQHDQLPEMPDTLHRFECLWQQPNQHSGELGKVLATDTHTMASWLEDESHLLHMNHAVLGAALFKTWQLPYPVILAIATHHNPLRLPEGKQLLAVITHFAEASTLYIGQDNGMIKVQPEQLCPKTAALLEDYRISLDQLTYFAEQGREDAESSGILRMF
jgi:HD-like signal output (HDOD) protein